MKPDKNKSFECDNAKNGSKSSDKNDKLNKYPSESSKVQSKTYNFTDLDHILHNNNVIKLNGNIVLEEAENEEYAEGIGIDSNDIVIDGCGFTIDAQKKTRIFKITGKNVTIKNITLKNGFAKDNGGAILNEGKLTLSNVTLEKNRAQYTGGAVYNKKGSIVLTNSILKENSSDEAGAIYNLRDSVMEVTECTFEDNTANAAGAIGNVGELTLTESTLKKNTAGYGGSIVNVGNLVVKDSILTNNKATEAQGGAIASQYGGTMKITESTLEKNKATSGGAIYSINSDVRLKNCSFIDNTSEDKGAAVCHETYASSDYDESSKSFLSCSNCDFDNNHSKMGGSVWTNDYVSFEKCRFRRNFSQDEGNVIYFDGMADIKMNITDSFIENTNAVNSDIYLKNPSFITIKNTNINNNSDNYVIRNENATLKISNTTFENNKTAVYNNHSVWIDEDGLEKYIESTGNAVVKNYMKASSSSNGFADLDALIKSSSDKIILESDIVMNECERFRYMDGIELNRDLTIDGQNHSIDAKKLSRIFKITCANVTLKNIQFKNGCYHKSKFHEDKEGGGAIYVLDNASVTIENCTFTENDSNNSAGCINNRGVMVIHNSIFKNNYAQRICGSIFNDNQLNLYDCSFEDNFAPSDKNSIEKYIETWGNIVNEGNISIKSCKFKNTNYFNLESVKIRTSNIMNYLLYPGLISFGIMIFGCIISTVINLIFPQSVIGEYLTKFTAADLVFLLVVMLISIILTLVQTSIKKYMNRNGFENYITE